MLEHQVRRPPQQSLFAMRIIFSSYTIIMLVGHFQCTHIVRGDSVHDRREEEEEVPAAHVLRCFLLLYPLR